MKLNRFRHFWALKNYAGIHTVKKCKKCVSKYSNLCFVIPNNVIHLSVKLKTGPKYSLLMEDREINQSCPFMENLLKKLSSLVVVEKIRYQYFFQSIEVSSRLEVT